MNVCLHGLARGFVLAVLVLGLSSCVKSKGVALSDFLMEQEKQRVRWLQDFSPAESLGAVKDLPGSTLRVTLLPDYVVVDNLDLLRRELRPAAARPRGRTTSPRHGQGRGCIA